MNNTANDRQRHIDMLTSPLSAVTAANVTSDKIYKVLTTIEEAVISLDETLSILRALGDVLDVDLDQTEEDFLLNIRSQREHLRNLYFVTKERLIEVKEKLDDADGTDGEAI